MFYKKIFFYLILIFSTLNSFAQWEFNYFVVKVGANHNLFSPQPKNYENLYLKSPEGILRLEPDSVFIPDYVPGVTIGVDFHFDMPNDKVGFIIGANYQNKGISAKYHTTVKDYSMVQTYRINTISVPVFIKVGRDIFNYQSYFFAGIRYDMNLFLTTTELTSFDAVPKTVISPKTYINQSNFGFVFGYNIFTFNFEISYYPKNFLNKNYSENIGTANDPVVINPFVPQPDKLFFLQTSLYIPLSPWTKSRIYFLNKIFR